METQPLLSDRRAGEDRNDYRRTDEMRFCFRNACAILAATLGFLGCASAADLANGRRISAYPAVVVLRREPQTTTAVIDAGAGFNRRAATAA